jgi:hypothetical protein
LAVRSGARAHSSRLDSSGPRRCRLTRDFAVADRLCKAGKLLRAPFARRRRRGKRNSPSGPSEVCAIGTVVFRLRWNEALNRKICPPACHDRRWSPALSVQRESEIPSCAIRCPSEGILPVPPFGWLTSWVNRRRALDFDRWRA